MTGVREGNDELVKIALGPRRRQSQKRLTVALAVGD